ncbi:MAG: WG repeat-containing protein [Bryobacterales bacterium]|nr:WG repeat-containing protein [Bryobacterales bacterium]
MGKYAIEPTFEQVLPFAEGYASVRGRQQIHCDRHLGHCHVRGKICRREPVL